MSSPKCKTSSCVTFTLHYDPLLSLVCVLLGIGTQPKVVVFLSTVMICVLNTALYHISDFVCVCCGFRPQPAKQNDCDFSRPFQKGQTRKGRSPDES